MIPGLKTRVLSLHDVLMYLALARRHLRLMALIVAFCLMCGLTYYIFARPVYHAQAMVEVDYLQREGGTEALYRDRDAQMNGVPIALTAPHILQRTAKALGVDATNRDLQSHYMTKVRAIYDSQQNLVVDVWVALPELANRWTEVMVREYLAHRSEKRRERMAAVAKQFPEDIEELSRRLNVQLTQRLTLENTGGLRDIEIKLKTLGNVPAKIARSQAQIDTMGQTRISLEDPAHDVIAKLALIAKVEDSMDPLQVGDTVENFNSSGQDGGKKDNEVKVFVPQLASTQRERPWDVLVRDQARLNEEIKVLGQTFLPGSRKMQEPMKKLAEINERLEAEYQVARQRFDLKFQQLINDKKDLEGKLPVYNEWTEKSRRLLTELGIQERAFAPFREYIVRANQKLEAVDYGGEIESIHLKYSGLIESQDRPVSPNRLKLIILSLAIGLVLALGVPFLIEYLDHTLRSLDQVESAFHMRGLGIVPQIDASSVGAAALISRDENHKDSLIENFRVIRTNVISMGNLTKPPHVTMVTSAMPKEGKTVVSSNLAVSFAHTGARTLLVDTDLRRGRLHRLFGYRKDPGLSNVLLNEVSLEEACRPTGEENLSILSAGRHLDSGTELLGSPRFAELMATLRERYDRIVIDTPPVLGLSETSIMQSHVDGVLFVIWTGNTPARSARTAVDMLAANGANFYGFVLNRLDLSATANYYQYYYYSHDYYYQHPLENA
jgi:capsular exopolysaccharide synthesis family protein